MRTIGEIVKRVRMLCPNKFTDEELIEVINDAQDEIYREMQEDGIYAFETVIDEATGQPLSIYTLSDNVAVEFIQEPVLISRSAEVTADSDYDEYFFARPGEPMTGNRYYDAKGALGIYPPPAKAGLKGKIFFKKQPTPMSASDLNAEPDLRKDWRPILVYACIIEIAGAGDNPDTDTVNNYTRKYNAILQSILLYKFGKQSKFPTTKDVMKRGRFSQSYGRRSTIPTPYN